MPGRFGAEGRPVPDPAAVPVPLPEVLSRRIGLPTSSRGVGLGRPPWPAGRGGGAVPCRWGPGLWPMGGRPAGGAGRVPPPAPLTGLPTSWGLPGDDPPGRAGTSGFRLGAAAAGRVGLEVITTGGLAGTARGLLGLGERGAAAVGRTGAGVAGRLGAGRAETGWGDGFVGVTGRLAVAGASLAGAAGAEGFWGSGAGGLSLAGGVGRPADGGTDPAGAGGTGLLGEGMAGFSIATGLAAATGLDTATGLGADTGLAGMGLAGAGAGAGTAFLTVRIDLAGAEGPGVGAPAVPRSGAVPRSSSCRIRTASSSLIELLWLFTATPSFSAASSTSLFSRPRSRDSS
jgi:hypothetical protein